MSRAGSRRRCRLIASAVLLAVAGLLVVNTVAVARQSAEAAEDSTLPLDGGNIYVHQDGLRDAPAVVCGMTYHAFTATSRASDDYLRQRARQMHRASGYGIILLAVLVTIVAALARMPGRLIGSDRCLRGDDPE